MSKSINADQRGDPQSFHRDRADSTMRNVGRLRQVAMRMATLLLSCVMVHQPALAQTLMHSSTGSFYAEGHGESVGGGGDIDGDGYGDVIVGSLRDASGTYWGTVSVYSGFTGASLFEFSGEAAYDAFGWSTAVAGDVDADGHADIIVGAYGNDAGGDLAGAAYVFSGQTGQLLFKWIGDSAQDSFGRAVDGAGDVDRDGHADLIVGAYFDDVTGTNAGSAYVYSGASGSQIYAFHGDSAGDYFGLAVAGAGDVNADGFDDMVVGAAYDSTAGLQAGQARVFSGKDGAVLHVWHGDMVGARFGRSVDGAGDVDGDAFADVVVGAPEDSFAAFRAGSASVFSGKTGELLFVVRGQHIDNWLGGAVAGAGDVDGDGQSDVIVGAYPEQSHSFAPGAAHVYSGSNGTLLFKVYGKTLGAQLGYSVSGAGDTNGDGFAEIIVGAPSEDVSAGNDAGAAYVYSPCPIPVATYCTAKVNSAGCTPALDSAGTATISDPDDLSLTVTQVLNQQRITYVVAREARALPLLGGTLCIGGRRWVAPSVSSGGAHLGTDCSGSRTVHVSHELLAKLGIGAGDTFYVQFVHRDPGFGPPNDLGLSAGLRVSVCP